MLETRKLAQAGEPCRGVHALNITLIVTCGNG